MQNRPKQTPPAPVGGSSVVSAGTRPPIGSPSAAELAAIRADLNDELSIVANAKRRYRWLAGISITYAPIFGGLGARLGMLSFLLIALVGVLSLILGTALFFREHTRWRALRAELLSTELLLYQQAMSDP